MDRPRPASCPTPTPSHSSLLRRTAAVLLAAAGLALPAAAQSDESLARFFGFDPMRIVVVDDGCGPLVVADFNNDGRPDIAVVNNRKSRIEIHYLRAAERTEAERQRIARANQLPPSPWYDREDISVAHRVTALRAHDVDGDGKLDIVYVGTSPNELVVLRQVSPSRFEVASRREVRNLSAGPAGLEIADVLGDERPEVVTIADSRVTAFPISADGTFGEPVRIGTSAAIAGIYVEDFDGDGMKDVLGVVPNDGAPLRLWLQRQDPRRTGTKHGLLAAELRFEMPVLREVEPVVFPDRPAASIGVIERATRRVVFYDLAKNPVRPLNPESVRAERQVRAEVWGFTNGKSADRSIAIADVDGSGSLDLLATDDQANTVVLYRQSERIGLGSPESFSAFKKPKTIAVGDWTGDGKHELFVLSEEEKAVGISTYDTAAGTFAFPSPLTIKTSGTTPVAMAFVELEEKPNLAVIVRDRRNHTLELHRPAAEGGGTDVTRLELEGVNRPPQSILPADADQDGLTDLLLFTPNEPMVMIRSTKGEEGAGERGLQVLTDRQMPQFGLVQAAGPNNTALLDIDGDGKEELLIADENFVRACRYDTARGWRVIDQITMTEPGTRFAGLAVLGEGEDAQIIAADSGNGRLVVIGRGAPAAANGGGDAAARRWSVREQIRLTGFPVGPIYAGAFGGDAQPSVLVTSDDGFALVRLGGERYELEQFAAYRSDSEDRVEHRLESGDLNGDGFVDVVLLDASDRMCQILSFSASRKLVPATEFEVFQSRLFTRGQARETEPRSATITDATGNGRDDLVLIVHDRVIVYPQKAESGR